MRPIRFCFLFYICCSIMWFLASQIFFEILIVTTEYNIIRVTSITMQMHYAHSLTPSISVRAIDQSKLFRGGIESAQKKIISLWDGVFNPICRIDGLLSFPPFVFHMMSMLLLKMIPIFYVIIHPFFRSYIQHTNRKTDVASSAVFTCILVNPLYCPYGTLNSNESIIH